MRAYNLEAFNMAEYVKATIRLSIFSYIWQPDTASPIRFDSSFPERQNAAQIQELTALNAWADRTDPESRIRDAYKKGLWERRGPHENVVPLDKEISAAWAA